MTNIAVVNFNSGEMAPETDARKDIEKYIGGCRKCENMIPDTYGNATRRPGTEYVATSHDIGPSGAYDWSVWMPEYGTPSRTNLKVIYGDDGVVVSAGSARIIGGNLIGIPVIGHPFVAGQQVELIAPDLANPSSLWTLQAETTANEIVISSAADWSAVTFDGEERVHLAIDIQPEAMFSGTQVTDETYIYYPCYREATYDSCVMRYDFEGTVDTTWKVNPTDGWDSIDSNLSFGINLFLVDDDTNIIITSSRASAPTARRITKARLSDGTELWQTKGVGFYAYAMSAVDDNYVYTAPLLDADPPNGYVRKHNITDGTFQGTLEGMLSMVNCLIASKEHDILVGCRSRVEGTVEKDCNLAIWDITEEEVRARVTLTAVNDEPYWADIRNGHIYVTHKTHGGYDIAKIDLQGNIVAQAAKSFSGTVISQYWRYDNKLCVIALMEAGQNDVDGDYIEVFDENLVSEGVMTNTGKTYGATFTYWTKKHPLEIVYSLGGYHDIDWLGL